MLAALRFLGHSEAEANQGEDQRHRNGDQQRTQQAAQRPMLQVFKNQFSGHFLGPSGALAAGWPTICNLVPSGCSSTNLSSDTPLLMSILTTSRTRPISSCGRLKSMCLAKGTLSHGFHSL